MKLLDEIISFNETFVENREYDQYRRGKFPNKRLVILSCMDTRLVELLPKSMNVGNGDAKIIKTAGALVSHPFGSIMRSILVAVYQLEADEVCVVGHHDCGMASLDVDNILEKALDRGITQETLQTLEYSGINLRKFLGGFENVEASVKHSVTTINNHPLMPKHVPVHGLVISPDTGKLDIIINGYED